MSKKHFLYLFILILLFLAGGLLWRINHDRVHYTSKPSQLSILTDPTFEGVLVTVGDRSITSSDLTWEYDMHLKTIRDSALHTDIPATSEKDAKKISEIRQYLLSGLIQRAVLIQYVKAQNDFKADEPNRLVACKRELEQLKSNDTTMTPESLGRLEAQLCEKSIINQFFGERIAPSIKVTEPEIAEYFKNHQTEFNEPERVSIRQIVLAKEHEAKKVRHLVNASNFSEMARKFSITPEGQKGGRLKPFAKGELPQVFNFLFSSRVGSISDIVKSPYGFHIIILDGKSKAKEAQLQLAEPKIRALLYERKKKDAYQKWINDALNLIPITPETSLSLSTQ